MWCLTMALIGRLDPRAHVAARACARPGHRLYVTGWPGESAAGLELLEKAGQNQKERFAFLIDRHLRPTPRLREGQVLASSLRDLAMMDVSDGIAMDAVRMARASGVRFLLEESQLPVSQPLENYARERDVPATGYTLSGGEDYELLFATDADQPAIAKLFKKAGIDTPFHRIGTATEGQGVEIESVNGDLQPVQAASFQHFNQ
jgi:thiamine-monophosphate kinase